MLEACCVTHSALTMRKDLLLRLGGYRSAMVPAEDYDLWLRAIEHTDIANLPVVLCDYRVHHGSVSVRRLRAQIICAVVARGAAVARRATGKDPSAGLSRVDAATLRALEVPADLRGEWLAYAFFALSQPGVVVDQELAWIDDEIRRHPHGDLSMSARRAVVKAHLRLARAALKRGQAARAAIEGRHALGIDAAEALRSGLEYATRRFRRPR